VERLACFCMFTVRGALSEGLCICEFNPLTDNVSIFRLEFERKDVKIQVGAFTGTGQFILNGLISQILIQKGRVVDCALSLLVADHDNRTVNAEVSEQLCSDWLNRILSSVNKLRDRFASNRSPK
jgi:hypothetical protein